MATKTKSESNYLPGGLVPIDSGNYFTHAYGGRCWDQYGNDYLDFICSCGPIVVGHSNHEVIQAAMEQMQKGTLLAFKGPLHEELNLILRKLFPYTPCIRFMKTGSEAVSAAIRIARAYTNKSIIIRCGFHGWHDQFISPDISWHRYITDKNLPRLVPGIPIENSSLVKGWDGESIEKLEETIKEYSNDVAAVILDPVQLREPLEVNAKRIFEITKKTNCLLILDEVKTGFRVGIRGAQGLYNIQPDISIFSKAIANGFPLAALLVSEKIQTGAGPVQVMGTYNSELVSIAAAIKTISILEKPESIPWLWRIGQELIDGINEIVENNGLEEHIQAVPYRWPCMPFIWFREDSKIAQSIKYPFYKKVSEQRVLLFAKHMNFTCLQHSLEDVRETLNRVQSALDHCMQFL